MKNLVRELQTERGWSQGELAERLGVSRQTVNALETEKYDPNLPLAFAIADLFGMRIEELFCPSARVDAGRAGGGGVGALPGESAQEVEVRS